MEANEFLFLYINEAFHNRFSVSGKDAVSVLLYTPSGGKDLYLSNMADQYYKDTSLINTIDMLISLKKEMESIKKEMESHISNLFKCK